MNRAGFQGAATPDLVADVRLYSTEEGGREGPALPGWGCPCFVSQAEPREGWDALPLLRDTPIHPGEARRLGFIFLLGEKAAEALSSAGHFYLWEGRFIGEATVVR